MKMLTDNWPLLLAGAAALQWLVFAGMSTFSRAVWPKNLGMRRQEKMLIGSSAALLVLWAIAFDGWGFLLGKSARKAVQASAVATRQTGSCATVDAGMTQADVEKRVGKPDQIRPDEEIRGPGAVTWLYRESRCAVHLLDGKVEFVD